MGLNFLSGVRRLFIVILSAAAITGCSPSSNTFTLYRNSLTDAQMRIHVASFDSADGADYNQANCELAMRLFMYQPLVETAFWCEAGRFKR